MKIIITAVEEVGESKIRVIAESTFDMEQLSDAIHKGGFVLQNVYDAASNCDQRASEIRETLKNDTREPAQKESE